MRVRDPESLRRWRQRRGLSQRDLAYLCRCSQAAISLLERGGMTTLSDELALNLSARLQVSWEELFTTDAPAAAVDRGDRVRRDRVQADGVGGVLGDGDAVDGGDDASAPRA